MDPQSVGALALLGWWGEGRKTGRRGFLEGMMLELRVKGGIVCKVKRCQGVSCRLGPSLPSLLCQIEILPFATVGWYLHI